MRAHRKRLNKDLSQNVPGKDAEALALSLSDCELLVNVLGPLGPSDTCIGVVVLTRVA